MAIRLDDIFVTLTMHAQQYFATVKAVEARTLMMAKRVTALGTKMTLAITAPLAIIGGLAVREFSKFDDAMTRSLAIMDGITPQIRANMEEIARAISRDSIKAPTELAESYFFLASAGLNAQQSMAALPAVTDFATAGMFDMAQATDLLTDAQSALGLTVEDNIQNMENMVRISDVLVKANTLANASVEQFSIALTSKAGSAIKVFNKDVEEGVAVLAAYADQGVKAELAGNALDRMLRLLSKASMDNQEAFQELGFSVFDSQGDMRNLANIIGNLEEVMEGMSTQQKVATLDMLGFQARTQQVILPLIGTSKAIREYEKQLRIAGGTTEEVATKQLQSFSSQMKILWNNIRDVGITIGRILAPALLWVNKQIQGALNWWRSLSDETQRFLVIAGAIAAAIGPLLVLFGTLGAFLAPILSGLATLSPALLPILAIVAAFGVMAAFLSRIGDELLYIWSVLRGPLQTAWNGLIQAAMLAKGVFDSMLDAAASFFSGLVGFFANFQHNMQALFEWIPKNWDRILIDMLNLAITFGKNWLNNVNVSLDTAVQLFSAFFGWLALQWEQLAPVIGNAVVRAMVEVVKRLGPFVVEINKLLQDALTFRIRPSDIRSRIAELTSQMGESFRKGATNANFFETAGDIISEQSKKFKGPFEGFISSIEEGPDLRFDFMKDAVAASEEITEQMSGVTDVSNDLHDEISKPFDLVFRTQGLEAAQAGTVEALGRFIEFQDTLRGRGPATIPTVPGAGVLPTPPIPEAIGINPMPVPSMDRLEPLEVKPAGDILGNAKDLQPNPEILDALRGIEANTFKEPTGDVDTLEIAEFPLS